MAVVRCCDDDEAVHRFYERLTLHGYTLSGEPTV